ncbi:alpha/beta fold hydrolase [Rhodoferax aquaticus]|uniref:Alpha/beta hydrolase n=1 Tax=Rhodoferax aquaticus TaxID=2527691 RepID=A0A515EPW9_9BURK|nr:alpha/beta hydrolase [Rhodoferax aquaticus]QDL54712.1 alpha/beta hydrolase [Rhodoferax aquaticus]
MKTPTEPPRELAVQGKPVLVYFHGAPGGVQELVWLEREAAALGLTCMAVDRFMLPSALQGDAYFQALAAHIQTKLGGRTCWFVGFSIGSYVALQTARWMQGQVKCLHLVSSAAPLESGDFLPGMAGKVVFQLAQNWPLVFAVVSRWQGLLAKLAPAALYGMLFGSAAGGDKTLAKDSSFQSTLQGLLASSLGPGVHGYMRDVGSYVQPWATALSAMDVPAQLWHGDQDNWSPLGMAHSLAHLLPKAQPVHVLPGLSHYSCLFQALPRICQQFANEPQASW